MANLAHAVEILNNAQIGQNAYVEYVRIHTTHTHTQRQFFVLSVGLAQARPNEKSTVQLTSVGLAQARPN